MAKRCLVLAIALLVPVMSLRAQRPDSTTVAARTNTARLDSLRPPLSPRRAFLYSALLPGSAQSVFGRHRAAALMLLVEAISIAMIGEASAGVREAKRMSGDSIVVTYVDASTGAALPAPRLESRRFDTDFVRTRQSQVEDWIAFLIANHLFSGADAYVAANLWDIPAQFSIRAIPGGASVGARLSW